MFTLETKEQIETEKKERRRTRKSLNSPTERTTERKKKQELGFTLIVERKKERKKCVNDNDVLSECDF